MMYLNINNCRKCDLSIYRHHIVLGEGNDNADIMIIGEAPGYKEDKMARPFVGKSGKYLDFMLKQCNIDRKDIFITNVVKCKPYMNVTPNDVQIRSCIHNLQNEIDYVDPKFIILLGNTAKRTVLKTNIPLNKLENMLFFTTNNVLIYATYHPSYIIRKREYLLYDAIWLKIYNIMLKYLYPNYEYSHGTADIAKPKFYNIVPI